MEAESATVVHRLKNTAYGKVMILAEGQRWLLVTWAVVLLTEILLSLLTIQPNYNSAHLAEELKDSSLLSIVAALICTVVIVNIIQADRVSVTPSSNDYTRSPKSSVTAKLFFGLLFLLLPSLIPSLTDVILFHGPLGAMISILWKQIYSTAFASICIVWLATFTRTLISFFGMVALLFVGLTSLSMVMEQNTIMGPWDAENGDIIGTRLVLSASIFFLGLISSLVVQHRARSKPASLSWGSIGIATTAIALLALFWWPVALPGMSLAETARKENVVAREFAPDWQNSLTWESRYDQALVAHALLTPKGQPDELPVITNVEATFKPSQGAAIPLDGGLGFGGYVFDNWNCLVRLVSELVPGVSINQTAFYPENAHTQLFALDTVMQGKLKGQEGTLILKVHGKLYRLRAKAALPLSTRDPQYSGSELIRLAPSGDQSSLQLWTIGYTNDKFAGRYLVYLLSDPERHTGRILQNTPGHTLAGNFWPKESDDWSRFSTMLQLLVTDQKPLDRDIIYVYDPVAGDSFETTLTAPNFTFRFP